MILDRRTIEHGKQAAISPIRAHDGYYESEKNDQNTTYANEDDKASMVYPAKGVLL